MVLVFALGGIRSEGFTVFKYVMSLMFYTMNVPGSIQMIFQHIGLALAPATVWAFLRRRRSFLRTKKGSVSDPLQQTVVRFYVYDNIDLHLPRGL